MTRKIGLITFDQFKNAIFSVADGMALTAQRTTHSPILQDSLDFSPGTPHWLVLAGVAATSDELWRHRPSRINAEPGEIGIRTLDR